jgi:hypothetical protein
VLLLVPAGWQLTSFIFLGPTLAYSLAATTNIASVHLIQVFLHGQARHKQRLVFLLKHFLLVANDV